MLQASGTVLAQFLDHRRCSINIWGINEWMKWINPLKTWQVSCLWLINRRQRQTPRIPDLWPGLFSITKSPGLGKNFVDILKFSIFHQYKDKVIFFLNRCTVLFCRHLQGLSNDLERSQTLEAVIFLSLFWVLIFTLFHLSGNCEMRSKIWQIFPLSALDKMGMTSTVLFYSLHTSDSWCICEWNTRTNGIYISIFIKYFQIALKLLYQFIFS